MLAVFARGIEVYAFHGVSVAEREVGHRLIIDVELRLREADLESDNLAKTADYGVLALLVSAIAAGQAFHTLERLAAEIGRRIFEDFELAEEVFLSIAKPMPPVPAIVREVGMEVTLRRQT